ncbi:hypothetical protein WR25_16500 [Diploscapter pachys]|uniref:Uncharacterized protein n=1 Tax=Diploscapter pachys TaxID=2018661 RepID=A0A2A2J876_9BILA|nr:hypothetical protein WR25_16500 [Diploscapter pachys]
MSRRGSSESLSSRDSTDEPCLQNPGPSSLSEALLLSTLPPQALAVMRHHRERLIEFTKCTTITEVNRNAIEMNSDGSPTALDGCSVQVTSMGGTEPAEIRIEYSHDEEQVNGTTVVIEETHHYPPVSLNGEEIIETRITDEVVIESEPYFWEPSYSRRDANVIDLHFAAANQQTHQSHLLSEEETNTSKTASVHIKGAGRTQESPAMESSLDQPNMAEKRPLSREDSNKFYRQSPSQSSDDYLVYAGDGEEQGSTKRGRSSEKEEGRLQQPPSKKKYMITGVHVSPSNTLTKGKRISSESGSNNTSVSVNEENQSLQAGITSVEMNSSMESVESQPRPAHRRKWNIKEHQMHLQPNNLIENGGVKMGNGTVKREVEEKVTVLGEIGKHQRGGSTGIKIGQTIEAEEVNHVTVQAPPKPPRWKIVDVRSEEDLGKPVTHSTPISTIEKKAREYRNRKTSTEFIDSELQRIIDTVDTAFVNEAITNSRRTSTSPIVVVDQNPSRRSSGANVLDAAEKEREEKKRKSTINDIDWVAAFAMKEPATPKSPRTLQLFQTPVSLSVVEENKDRQFLDVEEDNNRGKMRRLSAPETLKNKLPPSKIDLSEVFACTKGQKTDEKKCGCNACRLTRMSDRDMMRIAEERRRMHEESKAAKQIQSHTLPRRQQKRFSTEISLDEIFATAPSKPTVATPARQEPEQSAIVDSSDYFTDLITAPSTSSNRLDVHIPTRNDDFSNRVENIQATAGRDQTPEKIDPKELSYPMVSSAQTGNENESNHMSSTINHNHNQQYQQGQDQSDHNLLDLVFVGLPEPKRVERPHASSNEGYRKDWNQTEQSWIENVVNSAILSATISKSSDDILKDESGKQTETEPFIEMRQKKPDNGRRTTQSTYTLTSVKDRVAEYERRESEADKNKSMNDLDWIKNMMDTPKKLQTESEDSGIHRASLFHIVDSNEHVDQKPNEDEKFGDSGIYQSSLVHIEGSNESIESKEENILNKASFSHTNDSSTNRNQKESNPESSHLKDWIESLVIEQVTVATATVSRQLPTTDPISPTIIKESLGSDEKESTNQPRRASYLYAEEPEMKEDGSSTTTNEWVTEMLTKENANTSTETEGGQRDSPDSVKEEEDYIIESEEYKLPVASSGQNEEDVTNNPEQWIEAMKLGPGDDVQMKRKNSQRHFSNEDDDDEPRYYEFLNDSIALRKKHSLNLDEEETRKISLKYLKNTRTNLHENSRFLAELPKSQSQKELKFSEQLNEAEERINQNDEDRVQVDLMELVFTTSRTEDEYKSTETPSSFEFTSTTSTTTYNPLTQYLSSDTQNDSNDEIESQPQKSPTSPNGGSKTERLIEQEITYMLPYSYHDGSLHSRSTSDGDHNLPYSDISLDDVFAFQSRKPEQKTSEHRKQDSKGEASYHEAAERIIDEAFEDVFPATSSLPKSSHKVTPELNYSAAETRSVLAAEDKVRENNKSIASRPSSREQNSYEYYESTSVEPYRASSSARDTTNQTDVKYLSSARIHLNDTQTSSEPDEEYFARLIQENGERTVDTYKMERKMVVEREDEEEQTMSRYEAHRHFQTLTRDFSENGEEKEVRFFRKKKE